MWFVVVIIAIIAFSYFKYRKSQQDKEAGNKEEIDKVISNGVAPLNSELADFEGGVEALEFYNSIVSILSKAGLYTKTEKNSIYFEYKNEIYTVFINDAHALLIESKVFDIEDDEEFFFLKYINHLNRKYRYSHFVIDGEEKMITVRACYPVNDSTNISNCFWSIFNVVITAASDFHNGLNNNNL